MFAIARYVVLGFVCVVAAVVLWRSLANPPMRVAAVRLADVVHGHIALQGRVRASDEERLGTAKRFADAFDGAVRELAERENIVLLTSQAVISNIPDMTDALREEIDRVLESGR